MHDVIREATPGDIPSLVDIHCLSLRHDLLPRLGQDYLCNCFYPTVLSCPGTFTLVYEQGKILSFVIFSSDSRKLGDRLAAKKIALLQAMLKKMLSDPGLIWQVVLLMLGTRQEIKKPYAKVLESAAELYLIATHPRGQSQGYGSKIVAEGLRRLAAENKMCLVKTSAENAVRFYERSGFIDIGSEFRGSRRLSVLLHLNNQNAGL